jgi:DNA polymerase-3 subunit epsilon
MRFWWRSINEQDCDAERAWLQSDVYGGYGEPAFLPITACERHR